MNKRGLSNLVASVLIILIVLVAVTTVYVIIKNNFLEKLGRGGGNGTGDGGSGNQFVGCLNVNFEVGSCSDNNDSMRVVVDRKTGDEPVAGLRFIFKKDVEENTVDRLSGIPDELESREFVFNEDDALNSSYVDVAAILESGEICPPSGLLRYCEKDIPTGSNGFDFSLEFTALNARVGHPIKFMLDNVYESVTIEIDGKEYSKQDSSTIYYTPLRTGLHTFNLSVVNSGETLSEEIEIDIGGQNFDYLKIQKNTNAPMISLWNSSVGVDFSELADYHMCRMVFSGSNRLNSDRYFNRYADNAVSTHLADVVLQDLYENYNSGQDVCLFMYRFPHPWQFNPSDYNSTSGSYDSGSGFEDENWESPFVTQGASDVAGWMNLILNQINNGNGKPSGFEVDQLILDWEAYGGRHFENYPDGWDCKYQWFNIYSPSTCDFDSDGDGNKDVFDAPVLIEQATESDPRFSQAKVDRGVTFDSSAWNGNANYEKRYNITRVLYGEWDRVVRDMFFDPVKSYYPNVLFTQYNYALYPKEDPIYSNRGNEITPHVEPDASNAFSPSLYFCNQEPPNDLSVGEIMALEINSVKILQRNNNFGNHRIVPWVKPSNAIRDQDCPGTNTNLPGISDQQIWEAHLHFLMSGAESFIAWNAGENIPERVESMYPVQNAFATFVNLVPENSIAIETNSINANDDYWISVRRSPDQTKYILISFLNVNSVEYDGATLEKPEGESFGVYVI